MTFKSTAEQFGLEYLAVSTPGQFETSYSRAVHSGVSSIIEVKTGRKETADIHRAIRKAVSELDLVTVEP
jgi:2-succinyl-5-enolpyruvyl-6-hydroxy-3-cyclohexene-1-carboxylate synthase